MIEEGLGHLHLLGHRRFAFATNVFDDYDHSSRVEASRRFLRERGLPFRDDWFVRCPADTMGGRIALEQLMDRPGATDRGLRPAPSDCAGDLPRGDANGHPRAADLSLLTSTTPSIDSRAIPDSHPSSSHRPARSPGDPVPRRHHRSGARCRCLRDRDDVRSPELHFRPRPGGGSLIFEGRPHPGPSSIFLARRDADEICRHAQESDRTPWWGPPRSRSPHRPPPMSRPPRSTSG